MARRSNYFCDGAAAKRRSRDVASLKPVAGSVTASCGPVRGSGENTGISSGFRCVTDVTAAARPFRHFPVINNGPDEPGQREPDMTAYLTRTIRQAGIVLAFAVSFSALSATSSFAYSSEAQQMCTGDAFRLCSDEIPNISKITACMMKKRASLSTGCRAVMDRDLAQKSSKVAAQ